MANIGYCPEEVVAITLNVIQKRNLFILSPTLVFSRMISSICISECISLAQIQSITSSRSESDTQTPKLKGTNVNVNSYDLKSYQASYASRNLMKPIKIYIMYVRNRAPTDISLGCNSNRKGVLWNQAWVIN